jgi:hypothetical protein
MRNKNVLSLSAVGLMLLTCHPGHGAEPTTFTVPAVPPSQATNNDERALQPPIQQDASTVAQPNLDYDIESEEHPLGRGTPGFALLAGAAIQHTGTGWDSGATAAARYYFPRSFTETEGPESLSPWSVEVGGIVPHEIVGSGGGSIDTTIGGNFYHVQISHFSEIHLAGQYRWAIRWPLRVTPELSLGLSLGHFDNSFYTNFPYFGYNSYGTNSLGPLARVGLPLLANDWFALRMEVGYVHYSNKVNVNGQTFDLGLSGLGFYPSIQVSLGYLHSGVEKGVYLPPSALPLWAISALQTEKRSPIIAPPEVLLNAHQAQATGGLSGNVLFQYKNRGARKVELLADFNHWKPEPMYMDSAHVWVTVKDLKAGPYHYVYLINGKREARDPWNTSFDASQRAHGVSTFVVPEVSPMP